MPFVAQLKCVTKRKALKSLVSFLGKKKIIIIVGWFSIFLLSKGIPSQKEIYEKISYKKFIVGSYLWKAFDEIIEFKKGN